jgi:cupin fold WbuC family metalloprotein
MADDYPRALPPPTSDTTIIDEGAVDEVIRHSRTSPRKRVIKPFHKRPEDPLHRMLNAVQPGTYVRPHRHLDPPKSEAWILLRGKVLFFTFHDDGRVKTSVELAAGTERFGVDLAPGIYHTILTLAPDTVLFEVKNGPYTPETDKALAPWAPAEGDDGVAAYVESLVAAHRRGP